MDGFSNFFLCSSGKQDRKLKNKMLQREDGRNEYLTFDISVFFLIDVKFVAPCVIPWSEDILSLDFVPDVTIQIDHMH